MKILFDTNVPAPLPHSLRRHIVVRTGELGWQNSEDGLLLGQAGNADFDCFVTCDQSIRHQQNFVYRSFAMVVLSTNHWPSMKPVAAPIATKIEFAQKGQILHVAVEGLSAAPQ